MPVPSSTPHGRPASRRQRRTLSCLPCRLSKLRCDRCVPCQMCVRHNREGRCRSNPPSAAALRTPRTQSSVDTHFEQIAPSKHTTTALPPTPSSESTGDALHASPTTSGAPHHRREKPGAGRPPGSVQSSVPHGNYFEPAGHGSLADGGQSVALAIASRPHDVRDKSVLDEPASYWKHHLITVLPSQTQCEMLLSYFFENINWIYQTVHAPSLRAQHIEFWATDVEDVDLIWLALLYIILCLGAVFIPSQMAEAAGFEASDLPMLHRRWYEASRQALHAGGYDSKPTMTQLQVFLLSQLYWYGTKNIEALNSHIGLAVRNAQALGLDKEAPQSLNFLEREMRHRLWWDLVSSDTFQSLCLGRPSLLQSRLSTVPLPSNCRDQDITTTGIHIRPMTEPTEFSVHIFRARIFKIFNKLYIDNGANTSSYEFVCAIDAEVDEVIASFPWYLKQDAGSPGPGLPPALSTLIAWQHHILHSCINIQRVRMYRPFLHPIVGEAWHRCVDASTNVLAIYKALRAPNAFRFQRSQKMHVQAYQVFSAAVALATFLLVEMPSNTGAIRSDIELVIEDLSSHIRTFGHDRRIPLIADGHKAVSRILALYDARCMVAFKRSQGGRSDSAGLSQTVGENPTDLVPAIFSVFGGESTARRYLERCAIGYILNEPASRTTMGAGKDTHVCDVLDDEPTGRGNSAGLLPSASDSLFSHDGPGGAADLPPWNSLVDPSSWAQWGDFLLADLDAFMATNTEDA